MSHFADTIFKRTYAFNKSETWEGCAARVAKFVANGNQGLETQFFEVIKDRKFIPGGRYLYSAGRPIQQNTNCFLLRAEDSREGWAELLRLHMVALSTGGGVGTEYSQLRPNGAEIKRFGGTASGPLSLMMMVNEVARHVMAGGKRRSALWAGLNWMHPDIVSFIEAKNWALDIRAQKERDFNASAPLDMTNISVGLDDNFFKLVKTDESVRALFNKIVRSMCKTGEPGFSVNLNGSSDEDLRNPCCEVTSRVSGDTCNLGSIVLPRINNVEELEYVTRVATEFLYLGTMAGYLPDNVFTKVREENRRIGLGIMGVHEWLIKNDLKYEPNGKLGRWLSVYQGASDHEADKLASKYGAVRPIAVRAIAPTGTIGILGETSTGIEPVFCTAYKRRFLGTDQQWKHSYVIDPTVDRLAKEGVNPDDIEDTYSLAENVESRLAMQAYIQDYVDQGISSTVNMPEWGEVGNNNAKKFGELLLRYLPRLRGITVYPDGSRAGQPLTKVKYDTAKTKKDVIYEESDERCAGGVCGI